MVAADSRASMGGYMSSQSVKKIIERNPCMLVIETWESSVASRTGKQEKNLSYRCLKVGWDEKGPGLYYVDSEGGRLKGTRFSVGSGSPYAYGVLDSGYQFDMPIEEAAELAHRTIYHATFRDGASGGVASVYHVGPQGWKKLPGDDVGELHYKYHPVSPTPIEQEMAGTSPT